jgi:large subunit ribosomal protein L11
MGKARKRRKKPSQRKRKKNQSLRRKKRKKRIRDFCSDYMAKQTIEAMVEGGKASAGPPLGPALGPLKVNIPDVIAKINEKTKDLAGMKVPVKVTVDTDTREFEVEVGSPPIAALVKKELGLDKASEEPGKKRVGDLKEEQAKKIARQKFGSDDEAFVNQVKGTCRSMGITVGEGAVTEEEMQQYEEMKKAEEEAKAAAEAEKAAAVAEVAPAEAAPEGAPKEGEEKPAEEAKEGEEKKEEAKPGEKKEEKPNGEKKEEKK